MFCKWEGLPFVPLMKSDKMHQKVQNALAGPSFSFEFRSYSCSFREINWPNNGSTPHLWSQRALWEILDPPLKCLQYRKISILSICSSAFQGGMPNRHKTRFSTIGCCPGGVASMNLISQQETTHYSMTFFMRLYCPEHKI